MKTEIFTNNDRKAIQSSIQNWIDDTEPLIVNQSVFYDDVDEKHKAVISYYD